mgnify:CR=1 FL=1
MSSMSQSHTAWHDEQTRPPHERPRVRVVVLESEPIEACFDELDDAEVIAVRTVLELVGEAGSIDTGEPDRVVAFVSDACLMPAAPAGGGAPGEAALEPSSGPFQESGYGSGFESVIEALRVAEPGVRVVLVRTGGQAVDARGFDAVVREDDNPETVRAVALGESAGPASERVPPEPEPERAEPEVSEPAQPEPAQPEPARVYAPRAYDPIDGPISEQVGEQVDEQISEQFSEQADDPIDRADLEIDDAALHKIGDASARRGSMGPGSGGASDEQQLARIAADGGNVRAEALRMINTRWAHADPTGRSSVALRSPSEESRGDALRSAVLWNGRTIGVLAVEAGDAENAEAIRAEAHALRRQLEAEADWLAPWLALWRRSRAMRRAAVRDPLTGAYNRRYFLWYMDKAIETARDRRIPLTVLVFDIDHFKRYNDEYGHAAGDEILSESVRALRSVIRPTDRVCRIGGDEFAVVFFEPDGPRRMGSTPPDDVQVLARRVQERICRRRFPKLGEQARGSLTISGGLATYPWDGRDWRELLDHADELMLASKRQGKNAIKLGRGLGDICEPQGPEVVVRPRDERAAPNNPGPGDR